MPPSLERLSIAEFFGTFWLVLGGCGAAVLATAALPFGLAASSA